ncbi:unnamed protein product [Medioppia subpectinata]|uniref:Uncharacterized protein n=1 Tax=Medioppia subpectinata TaxID=1979941 RepID=A0A7R9L5M0_9ACAR|nr:unnamed protein product [Medioppia subpectinata]CAG2115790.1 unnamed protein product [Medioppia subpectinata]
MKSLELLTITTLTIVSAQTYGFTPYYGMGYNPFTSPYYGYGLGLGGYGGGYGGYGGGYGGYGGYYGRYPYSSGYGGYGGSGYYPYFSRSDVSKSGSDNGKS